MPWTSEEVGTMKQGAHKSAVRRLEDALERLGIYAEIDEEPSNQIVAHFTIFDAGALASHINNLLDMQRPAT